MSVYKCPVCGGSGFVPSGFYSSQTYDGSLITNSTSSEICRRSTSNSIPRCCSNCEMNDGMVYPSCPPKYSCILCGNFNEGKHKCNIDEIEEKENNQSK